MLQGGLKLPDPIADPSAAHLAESVFRFLADGKFLALLTVLFGVGLAIQFDSAARRGDPGPAATRAAPRSSSSRAPSTSCSSSPGTCSWGTP